MTANQESQLAISDTLERQAKLAPSLAWMLAVFAIALVVRVLHLWGAMRSPFFAFRGIDALDYHQMAAAPFGFGPNDWPGTSAFFWAPGYPVFLRLWYGLIGQGALALKLVQAMIGAAGCVLVYRIGLRLFRRRAIAVVAGIVAGLHGTLIYFDGQLLSASLDVFLQLLAIELLLAAGTERKAGTWWAAGVVIGFSVINRGAILLLMPFVLVWVVGTLRRGWMRRDHDSAPESDAINPAPWSSVGLTLVAVCLPPLVSLGTCVLHNLRVDGEASNGEMGVLPVAANMGINFYLGNHWDLRDINKTNHPQHFSEYDKIMAQPKSADVVGEFGASQYLFHATLRDIARDPVTFCKLIGAKAFELVHGAEIPRSGNLYAERQYSPVLAALLWKNGIAFPAGLVIPLGLVGMLLVLRDWRRQFLPLAAIIVQAAFVLAFFVTARYRLPAMPLLVLYGVALVFAIVDTLRTSRWGRGLAIIAGCVGLSVLANWRVGKADSAHGYYEHCLLAQVHDEAEEYDLAVEQFERGLERNPNYAWGHIHLARTLMKLRAWRDAEQHFRRGIELEPDSPNVPLAYFGLGRALRMQHRTREAVEAWRAAVARKPDLDIAHQQLCDVLRRMGKTRESEPHCAIARETLR